MKKIETYQELKEKLTTLENSLPAAPFWNDGTGEVTMGIDEFGNFYYRSKDPLYLQPNEALRLGKFLVKFYTGAE